jgi:hypothetical protein
LLTYTAFSHFNNSFYSFFSQEAQLGEFSIGLSQKLTYQDTINLNNIGISEGVSAENLDFDVLYNFPVRNPEKVFSPSIFELYLTFDFSKFRRNQRGLFKRINTDNYF